MDIQCTRRGVLLILFITTFILIVWILNNVQIIKHFGVKYEACVLPTQREDDCLQILTQLSEARKARLDGPNLFGMGKSCLEKITGDQLIPTRHFGDTSVKPMNTTHCFKRSFMESEKSPFIGRLELFQKTMTKIGVKWFINDGTLIGSLRHHGMIPWDDDMDIYIDEIHRSFVQKSLKTLEKHGFELSIANAKDRHLKLRMQDIHPRMTEVYKYRFCIDIFFYTVKNDTIYYVYDDGRDIIVPMQNIFPLIQRPFEGLLLKTPYNPWILLSQTLGKAVFDECVYNSYSNWQSVEFCEEHEDEMTIPCEQLKPYYPFVRIFPLKPPLFGTLELLVQGKQVFRAAYLPHYPKT